MRVCLYVRECGSVCVCVCVSVCTCMCVIILVGKREWSTERRQMALTFALYHKVPKNASNIARLKNKLLTHD